jgi:hypothetical protein
MQRRGLVGPPAGVVRAALVVGAGAHKFHGEEFAVRLDGTTFPLPASACQEGGSASCRPRTPCACVRHALSRHDERGSSCGSWRVHRLLCVSRCALSGRRVG